jgi:Putative oxidoreductase C terminal domain
MTERYEVTSELQRELVNSPAVFGDLEQGSEEYPAIRVHSVHYVMKIVSGLLLRRPAWFFDISEYGEGLADVGTQVIDLVHWTAFADQAIDYRKDIRIIGAHRWPLPLTLEQFQTVTGEDKIPAALAPYVREGRLDYYCNNAIHYTLRGVHVQLEIRWDWQAPEGSGDVYEAAFQGSKARIEIRQQATQNDRPELYIVPRSPELRQSTFRALQSTVQDLQVCWPGLAMEENATEAHLQIPEHFRVGHEGHFTQVAQRFFQYLHAPDRMPDWETSNMLAKYYVAIKGVELSQANL